MPTADRASNRPTSISKARAALLKALRRLSSPPVALRSNLASMAEEIHSVMISTSPAVKVPSMMLRTDKTEPPIFQEIWSSSSITKGSRPLTHKTIAAQATHEMLRSSNRTAGVSLNAACNTLTPMRITSREISTGIASLNSPSGMLCANNLRVA